LADAGAGDIEGKAYTIKLELTGSDVGVALVTPVLPLGVEEGVEVVGVGPLGVEEGVEVVGAGEGVEATGVNATVVN
jgi:hypothetical protein